MGVRKREGKDMDKYEKRTLIIDELNATYKAKNEDYGDSFAESIRDWGMIAGVVRLDDKMRRIKQLIKREALVKDETIRDTLMDMANYAIMMVMEMDMPDTN